MCIIYLQQLHLDWQKYLFILRVMTEKSHFYCTYCNFTLCPGTFFLLNVNYYCHNICSFFFSLALFLLRIKTNSCVFSCRWLNEVELHWWGHHPLHVCEYYSVITAPQTDGWWQPACSDTWQWVQASMIFLIRPRRAKNNRVTSTWKPVTLLGWFIYF